MENGLGNISTWSALTYIPIQFRRNNTSMLLILVLSSSCALNTYDCLVYTGNRPKYRLRVVSKKVDFLYQAGLSKESIKVIDIISMPARLNRKTLMIVRMTAILLEERVHSGHHLIVSFLHKSSKHNRPIPGTSRYHGKHHHSRLAPETIPKNTASPFHSTLYTLFCNPKDIQP